MGYGPSQNRRPSAALSYGVTARASGRQLLRGILEHEVLCALRDTEGPGGLGAGGKALVEDTGLTLRMDGADIGRRAVASEAERTWTGWKERRPEDVK